MRTWLESQLETLSPRDRMLLIGMAVFFSFALCGGMYYTLSSWQSSKASQVVAVKKRTNTILEAISQYQEARGKIDSQKGLLASQIKPLQVTVEQLVERYKNSEDPRAGLRSIQSIEESTAGEFKTERSKIDLKGLLYPDAAGFLHALETTEDHVLRVESARLKSRNYKGSVLVDLVIEVTVYSAGAS